ncbi:DEAD/DEAH box helicase family protein [Romboutsia timonensis]|uniref:DEAD/DEAH box helicase family protein n=1 Tax=Romboutsia timonensis TaxID=1776391 RepID=UPI0023F9105F|nr:DEAD/DEAH box helicase family protein [Romboutsia timonensis]
MTEEKFYKNEHINYSNYKPSEIINIDKYISEHNRGIINSIAGSMSGETHLLISQTGSGKTYTILELLKEFKFKAIFIVPNATNVEQIMREYDIPGAYGDLGAEEQLTKGPVVAMTWDKFAQIKDTDLSEYIAIVDEIHQTFNDMYRDDKIKGLYKNLDYCKGRIDITATPNKLDFKIYDYIVEYEPNIQTKYNVKIYNHIDDNKIIDIINNSNKFALLKDDTKYLNHIKTSINKKADIVNSNLKDSSQTYFEIVNNSSISKIEGILNTSVIIAGVNINEPNVTDIIVVGVKDPSTIKQYVARFRDLETVNVHIFNSKYNENISNTYEIEWLVSERIKEVQYIIDSFNLMNKREYRTQGLGLKAFKLENSSEYYYDNDDREYKLNIPGIRNHCYMNYYNNADIVSFKELLNEYFENIEIIHLDKPDNKERKEAYKIQNEDKKEALKLLSEDKNILVGANEILRNKSNSKLDMYFRENRIDKDEILEQLNDKCIPSLIKIGNIKKVIDLYTKYIIENNFNYDLAWYIANKGNRSRGKFFQELNIQVFKKIEKKYPQLIDNNLIENRIYNLLTKEFKPGISYTKEHLEIFIEAIKIILPGTKLTEKEIREKLANIYVVESKQVRNVPGVDYIYYKNIVPTGGTKTNIYTIKRHKKIADIAEDHQLSEIDAKVLKNIIDKRYKNIINSNEAQEILNIEQIFAS